MIFLFNLTIQPYLALYSAVPHTNTKQNNYANSSPSALLIIYLYRDISHLSGSYVRIHLPNLSNLLVTVQQTSLAPNKGSFIAYCI